MYFHVCRKHVVILSFNRLILFSTDFAKKRKKKKRKMIMSPQFTFELQLNHVGPTGNVVFLQSYYMFYAYCRDLIPVPIMLLCF